MPIWIQSGPAGLCRQVRCREHVRVSLRSGELTRLQRDLGVVRLVTGVPLSSAMYHWRFQNRSLAAFRTRNRTAVGWTPLSGYAVPLTTGVSLNCSIPTEMFGVPGISFGSQNGSVSYC